MVTPAELLRVLLLPLLVSAFVAGVGRLRMWAWAMPLALGVGFLAGYAAVGVPTLPPADGTDWLFWLAVPLTGLGILDATRGGKWGWLLGLAAGVVTLVVAGPLVRTHAVTAGAALAGAAVLGGAGAAMALVARVARPGLGSWAVGVALAGVLGGAAVVVMSSNLRVVGLYGVAAAAAAGPALVLMPRRGRGVTVVVAGLLAGLLAGGHFYPEPGVTWPNLLVLAAAPLLLLPAAALPTKSPAVRGVVGVVLVLAAVAAVAGPTAVAAKHAAEDDPYGAGG